ncbi:hypothetical protein [Borrelia parkeri]|uniref:hypothetical protein n=1 Tax=Borrelia parkeri TaxID=141 RepID=UPI0003DEE6C6|nr:hypothetical protein [Borrelia parkeri]AHF45617.1 hypothetical protein X966_p0340 [Borrelia parkeri HR1]UPA11267.1 hypothetical protein bpSLO_001118 [Borrelia parkeri]
MFVRKVFLKLLFVASLLVFFNASAKESQDFTVSYLSNCDRSLDIELNLVNGGNSFVIDYSSYSDIISIYLNLKSDHSIYLKTIELNGNFIHIDSSFLKGRPMDVSEVDGRRGVNVYFDFNRCKFEWKKLIGTAKGEDLKFCVICIEEESKLEKKYQFRVSAANLIKLIDTLELLP